MKTEAFVNSIQSFRAVPLTIRQSEMINAMMELGEATDKQLAARTGRDLSCVTARVNELIAAEVFVIARHDISAAGRKCRVSRLAERKKTTLFD